MAFAAALVAEVAVRKCMSGLDQIGLCRQQVALRHRAALALRPGGLLRHADAANPRRTYYPERRPGSTALASSMQLTHRWTQQRLDVATTCPPCSSRWQRVTAVD